MSRIGKKLIPIPAGAQVAVQGNTIKAKGAKGESQMEISAHLSLKQDGNNLHLSALDNEKATRALWGTQRMHIANMLQGLTQGFSKRLQIEGIGYRASVDGANLVLSMGYTHPVVIEPQKGITFAVEKNIITVSGSDKEAVGLIAARIRRVREPEPYKGKGIRYVGEKVRKKVGKKAAAGAGAK